ncbi:MAG: aldehyde dehydrogenase, partial [Phycisphaerae bacterium]|nr:aldehyde dehydrogenase [Phycisphaerae bacterium]
MAIKVGINGFGRIGRLVYRIGMEQGGFEFVGVNDLVPADNLAYLLRYDTTHRRFSQEVTTTADGFSCKGVTTKCVSEKEPAKLPWKSLGAQYVLESTGLFTEFEKAKLHIDAGAKRVLISAPTKSEFAVVPTVVCKVNHEVYDPAKHAVVSNASCTTNCLAPVAKVILDNFGFEEGLMTTVHAVTATQPTQD